MNNLHLVVDDKLCTQCGLCAKDCPGDVLLVDNDTPKVSLEAADGCIECQHCLAVCPTGALSVFGLDPQKSIPLSQGTLPTRQQMKTLARGRRSIRQYRDENVSGEVIDDLLADLAHAPTGCNNRALNFLVVDDKAEMHKLRESVVGVIESGIKAGKRMPDFLASAVAAYRRDGTDDFFRGAPHFMAVSAADGATCGKQDVIISLAYFELLAQCAGLGTVWCGLLDFAVAAAPEIRDILGIEKDAPFYGMMFGYPAVKYARTVQRDCASAIRRFRHE